VLPFVMMLSEKLRRGGAFVSVGFFFAAGFFFAVGRFCLLTSRCQSRPVRMLIWSAASAFASAAVLVVY
jgi:hypothetical protein